jgi:hypothetical protein
MEHQDQIAVLRDFIAGLRRFEDQLDDILPEFPTVVQIDRKRLTQDAAARLRRQIGWLAAEIVLGKLAPNPPQRRVRKRLAEENLPAGD